MSTSRPDRRVEHRHPPGWRVRAGILAAGMWFTLAAGCQVLKETTTSAVSNPGISLLAAFHPSEIDKPGIDLSLLKPDGSGRDARGIEVVPGDVLEITIQDLYEPGQPHTFPCRVDDSLRLELPLVGSIPLEERTCAGIERRIAAEYRHRELLQNPAVVVRESSPAIVTVTVTGAVVMPGAVRLLRSDATVFSAIAHCGGGKSNAGKQLSITRVRPVAPLPESARAEPPVETSARARRLVLVRAQSPGAESESTQDAIQPQPSESTTEASANPGVSNETPVSVDHATSQLSSVPQVEWFHLDREEDVAALRKLTLAEGDIVHITATSPPVRVIGHVARSGSVQVPPGRALSVWDVVDEAGGIRANAWPVGVTLYRPTSEAGRASQYSWTLDTADSERPPTELVQPGDIVHVAPSAGARIKNAVGGLWKKN